MAVQTATMPSQTGTEQSQKVVSGLSAAEYWTEYLLSFMGPLFKATGTYTESDQAAHLKFLEEHIAPNLGPLPTAEHAPYCPPSSLVGSPVDPSLNFTSNGKAKVRFDFDAIAPLDRSGPDPFGEERSRKQFAELASTIPGAYTKWAEHFMDRFALSPAETDILRQKIPPNLFPPPASVGLDFDGPTRALKFYIPGMRKAIATGESCNEIMLQAVRDVEPLGSQLAPALELFSDYLHTSKNNDELMLIGIDCVDPTKQVARLKCYLHVPNLAFSAARDIMTLGGRLNDEFSLKRVETLRSLWPRLMSQPEGEDIPDETWQKSARFPNTLFSRMQYTIEFTPGKPAPETKVYVPTFQFAESAETVEKNFEIILKELDHEWGHSGKYRETMETVFGKDRDYGQTFASFSSTKEKGAYTTSYFAKPIKEVKLGLAGQIKIHRD